MTTDEIKIQDKARDLTSCKQTLELQLEGIELAMRENEKGCSHEGVENYRGRQVGVCPICLHRFMNKTNVDMIFSE